jgi:hypothetical protein
MPKVTLAAPLTRLIPATTPGEKTWSVAGSTVRAAIECLLVEVPLLRGYLLDDHGALRHHIAAFVNGVVVTDKQGLNDPLPPDGELFLVPALSGG